MDNKTLEYMGERVDKARKLTYKIAAINKKIKFLGESTVREVRVGSTSGGGIYLDKEHASTNTILPLVKDAIAEILTNYRDQLQKELDEL